MSRVALAITVLMAAAVCTAALAAPRTATSFAFGRMGGNIEPFTISIGVDGAVHVSGPVRAQRQRLTGRQLTALRAALQRERLSALPPVTRCPGELPDFAAQFITVRTGAAAKTVLVHGDCSPRFDAAYKALSSAVLLHYGRG
jgi:hypothetical protein